MNMENRKKIALLGFGALGKIFYNIYKDRLIDYYDLTGIYTLHIPEERPVGVRFFESPEEMLEAEPDYVVEFAGVGAIRANAEKILKSGSSMIIASIGALADQNFFSHLKECALEGNCRMFLISGAIGGFDVMRTMAMYGGTTIQIDNEKAPGSINGAPYLQGRDLSETEEELAFAGSADAAIQGFPKNVNVAIAAALAAGYPADTQVVIRSIPGKTTSTHRATLENGLGKAVVEISSYPDPENPKSSIITAWSTAALLLQKASPVEFF